MARRFGPTLDAGTVIIEKEGEKTIQPAQLGSTAYVGILDRGPINEVIVTTGKKDLLAKTGGLIPGSLLPDAAQDFWDHSNGAGVLLLYRVTDGDEIKASNTVRDRSATRAIVATITADNAGQWAGRKKVVVLDLALAADVLTETTLDLPIAFSCVANEYAGATLTSSETGGTYTVLSHPASDGVAKTTFTLVATDLLFTEFAAGADLEFILEVSNTDVWGRERSLAYEIGDGQENPTTEWSLKIYINDDLVKTWADLNSDPLSPRYFVDLINDDPQRYISIADNHVGAVTASNRPANWYGSPVIAAVAALQFDFETIGAIVETTVQTGGASTIAAITFGAKVVPDVYTVIYDGANWELKSTGKQALHVFANVLTGVPFAAENAWSIGMTLTENAPALADQFTIHVLPLVADEVIGGRIFFPDESWAPGTGWQVSDNEETTATILTGDMTNGAAIAGPNVNVRLQYRQKLWGGHDGIASIAAVDFAAAYDPGTSEFNAVVDGEGYGLIKFATPGITELITSSLTSIGNAQLVERLGIAFADAKNHQYRQDTPKTATDEIVARNYVQSVIGKSDYTKVCLHGYCKVSDPVLTERLKTVPTMGMIHGWEARMARDFNGYHKVAAGIDVSFPRIRELFTDIPKIRKLNGEILNPAGIQRIEKKNGLYVLWGARIPALDSAFKFAQHRELLSYYEHVLAENFDWVIFAINDPIEQPGLIAALHSFFYPEWVKRAVRGDTFTDAVTIKIDSENNTDATRSTGDLNAEVSLRLADTVERFVISIGKKGAFEAVAA